MDVVSPLRERLEGTLRAATQVPTPPGELPLRFEIEPWNVHVLVEGELGRAARICGGAAVFVLALMLRVQGFVARAELLPEPGRPALLATVRFAGHRSPAPQDRALPEALGHRDGDGRLTPEIRRELVRAVAVEGARLLFTNGHGVLVTSRDDPFAQVVAGQALERVTLTGALFGVAAQWGCDVGYLLSRTLGHAQAVLRFGR